MEIRDVIQELRKTDLDLMESLAQFRTLVHVIEFRLNRLEEKVAPPWLQPELSPAPLDE